ncbi:hypothetical protein OG21DRAFT_1514912 [Imleria badia]|nr:hypothetical protein OG21DRAFT_1514912 [Imleria badia]
MKAYPSTRRRLVFFDRSLSTKGRFWEWNKDGKLAIGFLMENMMDAAAHLGSLFASLVVFRSHDLRDDVSVDRPRWNEWPSGV